MPRRWEVVEVGGRLRRLHAIVQLIKAVCVALKIIIAELLAKQSPPWW